MGSSGGVVEWYKVATRRWICSGDLMQSTVIIDNNILLYTSKLLRLDLKSSQHMKEIIIMWCNRGVSSRYGGNHIAIYKCITSIRCTPETYTMLHVTYISIKNKLKNKNT